MDNSHDSNEPVAWLIWLHGPAGHFDHKQFAELEFERRNKEYPDPDRKLLPLYTRPQAREPLTFDGMTAQEFALKELYAFQEATGCDTADQIKAREPLTDEQIMDMYNEPRSDAEMLEFARAIEAAHGIGEKK